MNWIKDKSLALWQLTKKNGIAIWHVMTKPDKTWAEIVADPDAERNARQMVYFCIALCTIAQFFGWWLVKDVVYYFALLSALFRFCALLGSWHLVQWLIPHLPTQFKSFRIKFDLSQHELLLLSAYGFLPIYIMLPVLSFTNILFLYIAAFYNIFLIYNGVVQLHLQLDENQRGSLTLRLALLLWLLPIVVYWLLCRLVPNAHLWIV